MSEVDIPKRPWIAPVRKLPSNPLPEEGQLIAVAISLGVDEIAREVPPFGPILPVRAIVAGKLPDAGRDRLLPVIPAFRKQGGRAAQ